MTAALTVGRLFSEIKGTPVIQVDDDLDDEAWAASITEVRPAVEVKPLSATAQLRGRVALAVVANEVMPSLRSERGWNTVVVSYSRMSLQTGWTMTTSKRALNEIVQLGLVGELKSGSKARARRFKVAGKLPKEQRLIVKAQAEMVAGFAGQSDNDSLAAVLLANVSHPAWNYGPDSLGHKTWWVALVDAAGLDPVDLGVTKRNAAIARRRLAEAGLDTQAGAVNFIRALDAYATINDCWDAKRAAELSYAEKAEARAVEIRTHQGYKVDALAILDQYTGDTTKIPELDAAAGRKFTKWLDASTAAFTGRAMPAALVGHIHTLLGRRIAKRIGDAVAASVVAEWILVGVAVDGVVPARRMLQMKAARGLEHLGATLSAIPAGDAPELEQKAWLRALQTKLTGLPAMTGEMKVAIASDLRARLAIRQWDVDKATKGSSWSVRDVAIVQAPVAIAA